MVLLREKRILIQNMETLEWKNGFAVDNFQEWMFTRVQFMLLLNTKVSFPSINLITDNSDDIKAIISHCFLILIKILFITFLV